jgi:hypothetical protein
MRIDLYTKTILTLIAVLLAVIALKPIIQPTPALAQANTSGVQFSASSSDISFFDPKSGDVWKYYAPSPNPVNHFKLTNLGTPLER